MHSKRILHLTERIQKTIAACSSAMKSEDAVELMVSIISFQNHSLFRRRHKLD